MPCMNFILPFGRSCIIISCICGIQKMFGQWAQQTTAEDRSFIGGFSSALWGALVPMPCAVHNEVLLPWESIIIGPCLVMKWLRQHWLIFGIYRNHLQALEVCECHLNTLCLMSEIINSLYTSTCYQGTGSIIRLLKVSGLGLAEPGTDSFSLSLCTDSYPVISSKTVPWCTGASLSKMYYSILTPKLQGPAS
jgi:hypothetical protein